MPSRKSSPSDIASQQQVHLVLPNPPPDIVPSESGTPATSETTFLNSLLIINVEGRGLAFNLAPDIVVLFMSTQRRKLLLIYNDMQPGLLSSQCMRGTHAVVSNTNGQNSMQLTIYLFCV